MTLRSILSMRILSLLFCLGNVYATTETQPKFTFEPLTATTINVPINGAVTVQYRVTNMTKTPRKLTMVPIQGVTPVTSGVNVCSNPFILGQNQSCLLTLAINGNQIPSTGIHTGPIVCKTKSLEDNAPDPLLCDQPSLLNSLNIQLVSVRKPIISVSPKSLVLTTPPGLPGSLTITNTSHTVAALNVAAHFVGTALEGNVTQDASNCTSVAPQQTCTLTFTPVLNGVSSTTFSIYGTNTSITSATSPAPVQIKSADPQAVIASIAVSDPNAVQISIQSGSPMYLTEDGVQTKTMVIQNNSSQFAFNIQAYFAGTPLQGYVTQTGSTCGFVPPGETCTLTFQASDALPPSTASLLSFQIAGQNTQIITGSIQIQKPKAYIADQSGKIFVCDASFSDPPETALTHCVNSGIGQIPSNVQGIALNSEQTFLYLISYIGNTETSIYACSIDPATGFISVCTLASNGATNGINQATGITLNTTGTQAYITDPINGIFLCNINPTSGALDCKLNDGNPLNATTPIAYTSANGSPHVVTLLSNASNIYQSCSINSVGSINNCASYTGIDPHQNAPGFAIDPLGDYLYIASSNPSSALQSCPLSSSGTIDTAHCATTSVPAPNFYPFGIALSPLGNRAYVTSMSGSNSIFVCDVNGKAISNCNTTTATVGTLGVGIAIS